jgi:hypothetical protein
VLVAPLAAGTFAVTARSRADPTRFSTASVSVRAISVTISPRSLLLRAGATQQFTATVTGSIDARGVWSLAEGSAAGAIDASGAYTAPPARGTFHVLAASAADPARTATAVVTVLEAGGVSVSLSPKTADLRPGQAIRLLAIVTGATDPRVIWTCDAGAIREDGLYTAPQSEGTFHVTAQSLADPGQAAVATLRVASTTDTNPVEPSNVSVGTGGLVVFRAHLPGTSDADVAWSIQEGDVGGSIDALGQYVAPADHEGVYHVMATSRTDPSITGMATVTVQRFDLIDHGGTVEPATRTFVLWWGDETAFPPDARAVLESLLTGLDGSGYLAIADEYMRGARATTSFGGHLSDLTAPPSSDPTESAIADKVCQAFDANAIVPAPGDMMLVAASVFPSGNVPYCAWHHWGLCHGQSVLVVYLPNPTGTACARPAGACNAFSPEATALGTFAAHEFMEAITDPFITAWSDLLDREIGDKCFGLAACIPLSTATLQLQPLYSNAAHACVQH